MNRRLDFTDRVSVALLALALCLVGGGTPTASAVSCTNDPYGSGDDGWEMGRDVEYDVSEIAAGTERNQVVAALDAWDNVSCLNINIQPDTSTTLTDIMFYTGDDPSRPGTPPGSTTFSTGFDYLVDDADTYLALNNTTFFNPAESGYADAIKKVAMHEIGHTMSLFEGSHYRSFGQWKKVSIMNAMYGTNDSGGNLPNGLTGCDLNRLSLNVQCLDLGGGVPPSNGTCQWQPGSMCPTGWSFSPPPGGNQPSGHVYCCYYTPIIVDVNGNGFNLTNAPGGVLFDIRPGDLMEQVSWIAQNSDDAWLALDRNANGVIDDGGELFGNFSPQPQTPTPNGFVALAEHDKAENGGNDDGVINNSDIVFSSLRLWQDVNHNGVSEPAELKTLSSVNIISLDLSYHESRRVDSNGNAFRYRAKVYDTGGHQVGRWAWDVFLQVEP